MSAVEKIRHIGAELKGHAPFTAAGAILGIAFMLIFHKIGSPKAEMLFGIFHPLHVLLSAMVTTALFRIHENRRHILLIIMIGYFGSIGVATLSDCIVPYIGEKLLGLEMPTHADIHVVAEPELAETDPHAGHDHEPVATHDEHTDHDDHAEHDHRAVTTHNEETEHDEHAGHDHNTHAEAEHIEVVKEDAHAGHDHGDDLHLGFIENKYTVSLAAALGIMIAFFLPRTKSPHAVHVLISTWATSAHLLMKSTGDFTIAVWGGIFVILFIAVWLPCCISDIIFPMLFVKGDLELTSSCVCTHHQHHSHKHTHEHSDKCGGEDKS